MPLSKARTLHLLLDECFSKTSRDPHAQQFFALLCLLAEQARGYQLIIARGSTDGPRMIHSLFTGRA